MEQHLERIATPARVRYAMKRHGMSQYDICKYKSSWFVKGPDTGFGTHAFLHAGTLAGQSVAYWMQRIMVLRNLAAKEAR
jgi:hypothetical protein